MRRRRRETLILGCPYIAQKERQGDPQKPTCSEEVLSLRSFRVPEAQIQHGAAQVGAQKVEYNQDMITDPL